MWIGLVSCHEAWSVSFLTSTVCVCVCVCEKTAASPESWCSVSECVFTHTHTHTHCRVKSTGMLSSDLRFLQWGLCLSSTLEMQIKLYYSTLAGEGGRDGMRGLVGSVYVWDSSGDYSTSLIQDLVGDRHRLNSAALWSWWASVQVNITRRVILVNWTWCSFARLRLMTCKTSEVRQMQQVD